MLKLPDLEKATMGGRAKKAVAVYPDGAGGAVYVYLSNGHFHNVHAAAKAGTLAGSDEAQKYDHPNATVGGMNINQIGRSIGTFEGRLNEAVAGNRDPREAHRDELMHAEKMGQYGALKAHHDNFGVTGPEDVVKIKQQAEYAGPIVEGMTSLLHNIRMANAGIPIKHRAEISSHFYDHVTKSLTDVARKITENPDIRFDYQQGGLVHGIGKGISHEDMQKLQNSGYFKDAHDSIRQMAEQLKNPVPENFLDNIRGERQQFEGSTMRLGRGGAEPTKPTEEKIPINIQGHDWFDPDIAVAKDNFMKPIGNLAGKIRTLAAEKMMRAGYGQQQSEALAHRLIGDMIGKMNSSIAAKHGVASVRLGLTHEGDPILDMGHKMHNHQTLAGLDPFRREAAQRLADYYGQLRGKK